MTAATDAATVPVTGTPDDWIVRVNSTNPNHEHLLFITARRVEVTIGDRGQLIIVGDGDHLGVVQPDAWLTAEARRATPDPDDDPGDPYYATDPL